jgi:beta-glucosidase
MGNKGATGNVACDHYHVWEQDVALMQELGLKHYRFSISWPRVVPTGKIADGVNEAGLAFYDGLIDALIAAGITPYVTLYHWDLPQGLLNVDESLYGWYGTNEKGHPSGQMTEHFVDYADLCFSRFGDRVKTWITFNEAWTFLKLGGSIHAPGMLEFSDSLLHPFIGGHNVLLAHASATKLYRKQYQASQGGKIGMTNNCDFREPGSNEQGDIAASQRLLLWMLGWLSDPIWLGDYPAPMRVLLGDKLPVFTPEERALVVNSSDFFGLNHYGTGWGHRQEGAGWDNSFAFDTNEGLPRAQSTWLFSAAWGFRKLLNWVDKRYGSPDIYVTEGGWSLEAEDARSGKRDLERTMYFANYTSEMLKAIQEDGVQVKGYFAWSLMDNFEWGMGYKERFGVVFNDFKFGLDLNTATNHDEQPTAGSQIRTPKDTSCWFKQGLWKSNSLIDPVAFSKTGGCDSWVRPMVTGTEFGVNVGGWLHLEEWFFSLGLYDKVAEDRNIAQGVVFPPHFPDGFGQTWASEGDLIDKLIAAYGEEAAIDAVLAHRAEYITEAEIKLMATTAVVTSVRLPLGWWAFVEEAEGITRADGRPSIVTDPVYSDRKFVTVTHDYLIGILEMFARNGLTVLLDLHAFPGGSSDGSYNGIWPYDPVFFLQDSLKAQGLDIVRRFCDFYNALPAYLKVTVSSVSIMNEPAHMLPAQTYSMFGWLAQACDVYRTSVVDVATDVTAPLLFVSLINTAPSIQEIVQFFIDTFTESELAEWAVMDIHHYFAWNSFASTCYDTSVPG